MDCCSVLSDKLLADEPTGPSQSPLGQRPHLLDVSAVVVDGRLEVSWFFSENLHEPATIQALAQRYLTNLSALIAHCLQPDVGGFTPSDFPLAGLDNESLAKLSNLLEKLDS